MAAFKEPEPGKHHPAPWKAVGGGASFDIKAELFIPQSTNIFRHIDRLNTVCLIASLLRLKSVTSLRVPVISDSRFSDIPNTEQESSFFPIELEKRDLLSGPIPRRSIYLDHLEWVRIFLPTVGNLFEDDKKYAFALLCLEPHCYRTIP